MASSVLEISAPRLFVIGDIHGCPDEPALLLRYLEEKQGLAQDDRVLFLGDYIDRGPDTRAVIDLLLDFRSRFPNTIFLKGNHEDMLLDFLGFGGRLGHAFLYNGGLETIQSYGISVFEPPEEMLKALPESHIRFLQELQSIIVYRDFICVHAGLHPLRDLHAQNDSDIFWIRDDFIQNVHPFRKTILFGHTPHHEVFTHLPYKVGIDTGLVFKNKLTCVELSSGAVYQIARASTTLVTRTMEIRGQFG